MCRRGSVAALAPRALGHIHSPTLSTYSCALYVHCAVHSSILSSVQYAPCAQCCAVRALKYSTVFNCTQLTTAHTVEACSEILQHLPHVDSRRGRVVVHLILHTWHSCPLPRFSTISRWRVNVSMYGTVRCRYISVRSDVG